MSKFYLAHARHDERGKLSGGRDGDQDQISSKYDTKGEVAITSFYVHAKGWYVLRPKSIDTANKIAKLAKIAANNPNIGYSQSKHTDGLMNHGGVNTKEKTATDCSGLVRQCIYEATNIDLGNFRTKNEVEVFAKSGLFYSRKPYKSGMKLYNGDIVVTKVKGHTAIVVDSEYKRNAASKSKYEVGKKYKLVVSRNIRNGHSTDANKKLVTQLSESSRAYCKSGTKYAVYKNGITVTCREVYKGKNSTWIRTKSGWICAAGKTKVYIK